MKVAEAACQVLHQFLRGMLQGIRYDKVFPNGVQDVTSSLFQLAIKRGKIPLDEVRIHDVLLVEESEGEELYLKLKDSLDKLLTTIIKQAPSLAVEMLQKSIQEF